MDVALSLQQWGNIAQLAVAVVALIAFAGAVWQILSSNANAKRVRTYEYADHIGQQEMRHLAAAYRRYFEDEKHTYDDFLTLNRARRNDLLALPNLIEQAAGLYHRKLLNRDVAAELLGAYCEALWSAGESFLKSVQDKQGENRFWAWEAMISDARLRQARGEAKLKGRVTKRAIRRKRLARIPILKRLHRWKMRFGEPTLRTRPAPSPQSTVPEPRSKGENQSPPAE
jgi:hypothetical protein